VLDPEQNIDFLDHYLDLRLDLSKTLFICTANQLDTIPGPLLDRMEVIRLAGYITEEKLAIAKHHLWPRLLQRSGIDKKRLKITDTAVRTIIEGYAREAGVRNLEKQLGRVVRKAAVRLLEDDNLKLGIGREEVEQFLGMPMFRRDHPQRGVGVVTGLAWTALGGVTLAVECSRIHTLNRGFKITGKLGDVMKESADIAYSYVMSNLKNFGAGEKFFDESMIHLHVPEGATPKDGPSAGVTMATALLSLARNERPRRPLAMTGELTLTGQVLPVGGIREKVIAAKRAGIKELVLPEPNRRDYEELPDHIRAGLTVHFAGQYDDVFRVVFGK
jgi:ATP-dependent Lon protease